MSDKNQNLSEVEHIKSRSNFLRGTINEGLIDEITGSISADDTQLIKFHGSYQQPDRDLESERKKQKLEPLYSFMIRVRLPGGLTTPEQWIAMDKLADSHANGTLKLTTRQAYQLHGVLKKNLKATIASINHSLMDTIAACGDVNRNVMCNPNSGLSEIHAQVLQDAQAVSDHLTPQTSAYHEIWLEGQKITETIKHQDSESVYGDTYLPRKFKIAFAIPPRNDVDVFTNDLGFTAIVKNKKLSGYNISVGGGMGMTFGNETTYPRLADVIGFIPREKAVELAEKVVILQRDNGNRSDRKNARLKYTIDRMGLYLFVKKLNGLLEVPLKPSQNYSFEAMGDEFGWKKGDDNLWYYTLFVEGGRVCDKDKKLIKTALREIAAFHEGDFRLTGNQNLVIAKVPEREKKNIEGVLKKYGAWPGSLSGIRKNAIACVALNTCSLAFAEAERYLPSLIDKIDEILEKYKLKKEEISIRMTGCPNGCARPYNAEIGLVGRAVGVYNLYLGGGFTGNRLNRLYKEMVKEEEILSLLDGFFKQWAAEKKAFPHFGDFITEKKIV